MLGKFDLSGGSFSSFHPIPASIISGSRSSGLSGGAPPGLELDFTTGLYRVAKALGHTTYSGIVSIYKELR